MTTYLSAFATFGSLSPDHLIALVALAALAFAAFVLLWMTRILKAQRGDEP
jgi:hypothetical protein